MILSVSILGVMLAMNLACDTLKKKTVSADQVRAFASDLINRALYKQAISEYQRLLEDYDIEPREQANINYIIANTYFDRVKDYESALTFLLRIKHYYPETSLMDEVNKKIVACLERLERSADARQAMDEAVQLYPENLPKKRPGAVVAMIGEREITQGDIDYEIDQLPPSVREQFRSRDKKMQFLNEYVATELMYDTAKRANLDNDPSVIEGTFQAKKMLMVRKLLQERVASKLQIAPGDLQLYYEAHKQDYSEKDASGNVIRERSLDQVQQQVAQDLTRRKYEEAYQKLILDLVQAQGVKFMENNVQ